MGKRIGYIDAMRGLAMLLVVVGHVMLFTLRNDGNMLFRILSGELQIPLFFMVSGFLVSVPRRGFWSFVGKKAFLLCVPAVIFMAAYVWNDGGDYVSAWVDSYKGGYWFTFTLFQFVAVYAVLKLALRSMKLSRAVEAVMLVAVGVVALYASVWCMREEHTYAVIPLLGLVQFKSFIYFLIGTLIAEHGLLAKGLSDKEIKVGGGNSGSLLPAPYLHISLRRNGLPWIEYAVVCSADAHWADGAADGLQAV